ncbi:MAG: arginine--tRNA ligase, partial [Dehalococcoidia bacterium]
MLKKELARCLQQAVWEAQRKGDLVSVTLPDVLIERPQNPEHGDFATGLPLKLARAMNMSPVAIAEKTCQHLVPPTQIDKVWVAPPGFISFTLREDWLGMEVESILAAGESYSDTDLG